MEGTGFEPARPWGSTVFKTAVEAYGVERWAGELSRDLRDGTYEPSPVRQVLIPKKQPGKFRPLGIPRRSSSRICRSA